MPIIVKDECLGCGVCLPVCPVGALSLDDENKVVINKEICTKCGACIQVCPAGAVKPGPVK